MGHQLQPVKTVRRGAKDVLEQLVAPMPKLESLRSRREHRVCCCQNIRWCWSVFSGNEQACCIWHGRASRLELLLGFAAARQAGRWRVALGLGPWSLKSLSTRAP